MEILSHADRMVPSMEMIAAKCRRCGCRFRERRWRFSLHWDADAGSTLLGLRCPECGKLCFVAPPEAATS